MKNRQCFQNVNRRIHKSLNIYRSTCHNQSTDKLFMSRYVINKRIPIMLYVGAVTTKRGHQLYIGARVRNITTVGRSHTPTLPLHFFKL